MTLPGDRPNGVDITSEFESPFLSELPWAKPNPEQEALGATDFFAADPFQPEAAVERDGEWEALWRADRLGATHEEEAFGESAFESDRGENDLESEEEDIWSGARHEGHVCHECGRELEHEAWSDEVEAESELSFESGSSVEHAELLSRVAAEAEFGIGEIPFEPDQAEFEEEAAAGSDVQAFAQRLGAEWSRRRNGTPTAEAMTAWLIQDHADTVHGAEKSLVSYMKRLGATPEQLTRAWMISREENMKFQGGSPGVKPLPPFEAPQGSTLTSSKLIENSVERAGSRVATLTLKFAEELRRRYPSYVRILNYEAHGGGGFTGRGYSLDLFIKGRDDRGFFPPDESVRFLKVVHETSSAVGAQWRVLYNDFSVADVVNRALGRSHVIYIGHPTKKGKIVWHGPDPLLVHFHLDLAPLNGVSPSVWANTPGFSRGSGSTVPAMPVTSPSQTPPASATPSAKSVSAEQVRFAQRILNVVERERLGTDGDLGALTRAALERFRKRYQLGATGVLDTATELALVQRAFEELAQQSIFARVGVRDSATDQALTRFRQERSLGLGAAIDASTRAALAEAVEARSGSSSPSKASASSSTSRSPTSAGKVDAGIVSRIEQHRDAIERIAREHKLSSQLFRGVIAAESAGHTNTGAGTKGYKGLTQCERTDDQLTPEVSLRCFANKYGKFAASMRNFLRGSLKRDLDALAEDTRVRIVMASFNAGPRTVQLAMQFAAQAGDSNQWLLPDHYLRALLSTGAYNPVESVLDWGLKKGRLTADALAADLARLSGKSVDEIRTSYATGGKWDTKRLAVALRALLFSEKSKLAKDHRAAPLATLRSNATTSLVCAAEFKQAHTNGYLDTILRYKKHFEGR